MSCPPDFRAQINELLLSEDLMEEALSKILSTGKADGCTRFRCTTRTEPSYAFLIEGWKAWPGDDYLDDPKFDLQEDAP